MNTVTVITDEKHMNIEQSWDKNEFMMKNNTRGKAHKLCLLVRVCVCACVHGQTTAPTSQCLSCMPVMSTTVWAEPRCSINDLRRSQSKFARDCHPPMISYQHVYTVLRVIAHRNDTWSADQRVIWPALYIYTRYQRQPEKCTDR